MSDLHQTVLAAKRPKTVFAGTYGHPIHPILVTVPIGAWTASVIFDIVALASADGATFAAGAYWLIGIGIVGAVLDAVFGLLDLLAIPRGTKAFRTAVVHLCLNLAVVIMFAINFGVRTVIGNESTVAGGFALSLIALVALGVSGWLGGRLSYRYGVRVAAEDAQQDGFRPRA